MFITRSDTSKCIQHWFRKSCTTFFLTPDPNLVIRPLASEIHETFSRTACYWCSFVCFNKFVYQNFQLFSTCWKPHTERGFNILTVPTMLGKSCGLLTWNQMNFRLKNYCVPQGSVPVELNLQGIYILVHVNVNKIFLQNIFLQKNLSFFKTNLRIFWHYGMLCLQWPDMDNDQIDFSL